MKKIIIILAFVLISSLSIFADIVPNNAKGIRVDTEQDYPDLDFYYGSIPTKRPAGADYGTESYYNSLELTPIKFSANYPFDAPSQESTSESFFLTVKKSLGLKNDSELKNKAISALKKENIDGIYFFYLSNRVYEFRDEGKTVVYTLGAISNNRIATNRHYADPASLRSSKFVYLAVGFALTAVFIALGLILIKKLKKK